MHYYYYYTLLRRSKCVYDTLEKKRVKKVYFREA